MNDGTPRVEWARFSDGKHISTSKMLILRTTENRVMVGYIEDCADWDKDIRVALRDEDGRPFPNHKKITHYSYLCLPMY
jgi:hypothetical protein